MGESMRVCPRCGSACGDDDSFCGACGYLFSAGPASPAPRTNPLAVAALVLGILSPVLLCCYGFGILPAVLAMIFGGVARGQLRRAGGGQAGRGLATAGLVLGIVTAGLFIVLAVLLALSAFPASSRSMMPFSGPGIHL